MTDTSNGAAMTTDAQVEAVGAVWRLPSKAEIQQALRNARDGGTLRDFAEVMGMPHATLNRIERGHDFSYSTALKLSAALFTAPAPAVPIGWKLVPVEPTDAMLDAAVISRINLYPAFKGEKPEPSAEDVICATWEAMLAAAPEGGT